MSETTWSGYINKSFDKLDKNIITITNDDYEVVYQKTRLVKTSDYENYSGGKKLATIYIDSVDIKKGKIEKGEISFEIYNDYVNFDASILDIRDNLPLEEIKIILPQLPTTLDYYYKSFSGKETLEASVKITSITYEIKDDDLYIYFAGEKIYDSEGKNYSRSVKFGWKLYDSEGYVIDSGDFYSTGIKTGEKFRNEKISIYNEMVPGKTYKLVLLDLVI